MIYHAIQNILNAPDPLIKYGYLAGVVAFVFYYVKSSVFRKIGQIFVLFPIIAWNGYLMSSFYARNGTSRAFPSRIMPTDVPHDMTWYEQYLALNFGTNHWYMIVLYMAIVLMWILGSGKQGSTKIAQFERESRESHERGKIMLDNIKNGIYSDQPQEEKTKSK